MKGLILKWLLEKLRGGSGGVRLVPLAALLAGVLALFVAESPLARDVAQEFCASWSNKGPEASPPLPPRTLAPVVE